MTWGRWIGSPKSDPLLCIDFGADGGDTFYLGAGWSAGEPPWFVAIFKPRAAPPHMGPTAWLPGLGDIQHLEFWLSEGMKREYVIRDCQYGLVFHTFLYENDMARDALLPQLADRVKFLCRKILDDLQNGEKILVCKRNAALSGQEVLSLSTEENRYGPNTLLWVTAGEEDHTPGTVDRIMPRILRGYIDRFAPYENAHDLSMEVW